MTIKCNAEQIVDFCVNDAMKVQVAGSFPIVSDYVDVVFNDLKMDGVVKVLHVRDEGLFLTIERIEKERRILAASPELRKFIENS